MLNFHYSISSSINSLPLPFLPLYLPFFPLCLPFLPFSLSPPPLRVPEFVKEKRFYNWLRDAKDWSVSRNRYWGTPIPIWASEDLSEV